MKKVKKERTNRRDLAFNNRHREYGYDCPAVDLDLFLEYDNGQPCALIEYKQIFARPLDMGGKTMCALETLATHAGIPSFCVWYWKNPWRFYVVETNQRAESALEDMGLPRGLQTELDFVTLLYALRGRYLSVEIGAELDNVIVGNERMPRMHGLAVPGCVL